MFVCVAGFEHQLAFLIIKTDTPQLMLCVASNQLNLAYLVITGEGNLLKLTCGSTNVRALGSVPVFHHKVHAVVGVVHKSNQRIIKAKFVLAGELKVVVQVELLIHSVIAGQVV